MATCSVLVKSLKRQVDDWQKGMIVRRSGVKFLFSPNAFDFFHLIELFRKSQRKNCHFINTMEPRILVTSNVPPGFPPIFITRQYIAYLIRRLNSETTRQIAINAILELRGYFPDLAEMLWYSRCSLGVLLRDLVHVYSYISNPPTLTMDQYQEVGNILSLMEIVGTDNKTCPNFVEAKILDFLIPILATSVHAIAVENLRNSSLELIDRVVKSCSSNLLEVVLESDILPMSFRVMGYESTSPHSQMLVLSIVQKVLSFEVGLNHFCKTCNNFTKVATPLARLVVIMEKNFNSVLAKKIIECYLRLSEHPTGILGIRFHLPTQISDPKAKFTKLLLKEKRGKMLRVKLMATVNAAPPLFSQDYPEIYNALPVSRLLPIIRGSGNQEKTLAAPNVFGGFGRHIVFHVFTPNALGVSYAPDFTNFPYFQNVAHISYVQDVTNVQCNQDAPIVPYIEDVTNVPDVEDADERNNGSSVSGSH